MDTNMNLVNVSISKSKVFSNFDVLMLRFGLLVSDFTFAAGDIYIGIMAEDNFNAERTMKQKIEMVTQFNQQQPQLLKLEDGYFERLKITYKQLNAVKYKSAEQIKQYRAIEKTVNEAYVIRNSFYSHNFTSVGMQQLKRFTTSHFRLLPTDCRSPEVRVSESYHLMSDLLLDRFNSVTGNDIFMVSSHFGTYLKEKNTVEHSLGNNGNTMAEILSAKKVLTMPCPVYLSEHEIEMIREHILSSNQPFRTNMAQWCKDLLTVPFVADNFKSITDTFISEIEPNFKLLQKEMDNQERLRLLKNGLSKTYEFNINLYVTSVGLYWNYLLDINTITSETMNILKEIPDYENLSKNACIIIEGDLISLANESIAITKEDLEMLNEKVSEPGKRKMSDI